MRPRKNKKTHTPKFEDAAVNTMLDRLQQMVGNFRPDFVKKVMLIFLSSRLPILQQIFDEEEKKQKALDKLSEDFLSNASAEQIDKLNELSKTNGILKVA